VSKWILTANKNSKGNILVPQLEKEGFRVSKGNIGGSVIYSIYGTNESTWAYLAATGSEFSRGYDKGNHPYVYMRPIFLRKFYDGWIQQFIS
jgi:hypothetical protein